MSDHPTSELVVATPTIEGRKLEIIRLTWSENIGLSYGVYDEETGECLTEDGDFDDMPTEEQLTDLVRQAEDEGRLLGAAGRNDADIVDEIVGF